MGVLGASFNVHKVEAQYPIIYIKADGSIDPSTANITSSDNVTYTFTADINARIVVEKDNIVVDGAGYTVQGPGSSYIGISLDGRNNVTIKNVEVTNFTAGIYLSSSTNNNITGNTVSSNNEDGIVLSYSSNNTVTGNTASNGYEGIRLTESSYNNITGNVASNNNDDGIHLEDSSNNSISGNNITGNSQNGIYLYYSSDNKILSNTFSSNLGSGIFLYYSSDNTILKNMDFSDSMYGIVLWSHSRRNIVSENILSLSHRGITMGYSDDNRILNNTVSRTDLGIEMQQICRNSIIANNMVSESNECGIYIESENEETRYNAIVGNNIMHSLVGIRITRLSGNVIYHNNFVDNTNQTSVSNSTNIWDDGVEGNYWSNYTGVDLNHDGIGDTPHVIDANNTDNYPLMGMFHSFNTTLGKYVNVISNSTIDNFQHFESNSTIVMYVSNMTANQTYGFCRVSIPYEVMSEPFNVTIDGANPTYWNYTLYDNGTHRWIYFEYEHSTLEIVIIPEFPSFLILPLFMIATLLAVIVYRRKRTA